MLLLDLKQSQENLINNAHNATNRHPSTALQGTARLNLPTRENSAIPIKQIRPVGAGTI